MPYEIVDGDITTLKVDAIVNSTSMIPSIGTGVDHDIFSKGGKQLFEDRIACGEITYERPCMTKAYHLPSKFVIHVNGPINVEGRHKEKENLFATYFNALLLAYKKQLSSIAFPLISSGN